MGTICRTIPEDAPKDDGSRDLGFLAAFGAKGAVRPLDPSLVTLSGAPSSRWSTLPNFDLIKERNKPINPPEKKANAPFFLPTTESLMPTFDLAAAAAQAEAAEKKRKAKRGAKKAVAAEEVPKLDGIDAYEVLLSRLTGVAPPATVARKTQPAGDQPGSTEGPAEHFSSCALLNSLGASAAVALLRSLPDASSAASALDILSESLEIKPLLTDDDAGHRGAVYGGVGFEMAEAHMNVLLEAHGLDLARSREGRTSLARAKAAHESTWERVRARMVAVETLTTHFLGQM